MCNPQVKVIRCELTESQKSNKKEASDDEDQTATWPLVRVKNFDGDPVSPTYSLIKLLTDPAET